MAVPLQTAADVASDFATTQFIIQSMLAKMNTAAVVKVVACTNNGGLSPWGTVDVIPLVNQVTGDNVNVPHGTVFKLPYSRLQGGLNAVILDPEPGDIGLAVFASRDSSAVKADPAAAVANAGNKGTPPGSGRQYAKADGFYFGGFLNAQPQQYVQFSPAGIKVSSPTAVTVVAPSITLDGPVHVTGTVTGDSSAVFTGDVTAQGTSLHNHTHSGVQTGGGNTGPPNP
jgi:hypothetical protein